MHKYVPLCAACYALVILAGCNSGPTLAPVKGVLTYKGKALPNIHLDFEPEKGDGRPSWGQTDAQGRFTLEYDIDRKGVLIGKHKVYAKMGSGGEKVPGERPPASKDLAEFFEKYGGTNSKVIVEIQANTREVTLAWD